ncbi:hypothetical protein [Streptomyces sp. NPDC085540]|uniref:hypothetical protein n=1 Tax=Streptomyces sp. NPDC085540 TaxID=3365730 RepID=UPI0037D0775D
MAGPRLRAVVVLERIAALGWEATGALDDGLSAEWATTPLGTTRSKAQILLLSPQDR